MRFIDIYTVLRKYYKSDSALIIELFNDQDYLDENKYKFGFRGSKGTIYATIGAEVRFSRIFDTKNNNELKNIWRRGITANPNAFYDNVRITVKRIESEINNLKEDIFSSFTNQKTGLDINSVFNNIDGHNDTERLTDCIFHLFMISLGVENVKSASYQNDDDHFEDDIYYSQTVFDSKKKNSFFSIENADFSQLKKERLVLIEGEGGQGKSTFLKKLNELKQKQSDFKNIIVISLARFVDFLNKSDIQPLANKCTYIVSYILNNNLSSKDIKSVFCRDGEPTLLLLDGFNEAYAFSDTTSRNAVIDELEEIKNKYANICFVVTTRPSEGSYSFKKCDFLKDFSIYYLSGVSDEMYQKFISKHNDLPKEILEIARIPLYFKALNKSNNLSNIKNRNDLLREIYYQNYKQASEKPGAENTYFAYYLLAPAIANFMCQKRQLYIDVSKIQLIARELFDKDNMFTALLHSIAARECPTSDLPINNNIEAICNALINNGPLEPVENDASSTAYRFFHDEIRKYLLAYNTWMVLTGIKSAMLQGDYPYVKVTPNLNLETDVINLLKIRLNISGDDENKICKQIASFFKVNDFEFENLAWQIKFYHIAFLFSEYLCLKGSLYLNTYHSVLSPITEKIMFITKIGQYDQYFYNISEVEKTDIKSCILDILCKECEYFRRNSLFDNGEKCIETARQLSNIDYSVINQHAKINLAKFEASCLSGKFINQDSFNLGMKELKTASENGFILSANLLSLIYSAPNPILTYANKHTNVDNVESFYILYSAIQKAIKDKLYAHEIDYSIRQAVALLLKGYVRLSPGSSFFKGIVFTKENFCQGNLDTFSIDEETIKLSKHLLEYADGLYRPSLDYLRAIIKIYENKPSEAESLLTNESDLILNRIVLNYKFGKNYDIDASIKKVLTKLDNKKLGLDICHPIYWALIDPMHLELSLNPSRKEFYDKMIEELDDICKKTVKLLNL